MMVPIRVRACPMYGATAYEIIPFPVPPLDVPSILIHETFDEAVQVHSDKVRITTLPVPPDTPKSWLAGESMALQPSTIVLIVPPCKTT
jgi:hypothetical protein